MRGGKIITGRILLLCALLLSVPCTAWAKTIYVDDDANTPGDGSSWQTAYKYLQDALAVAKISEKPVEIRIAQGIYKPDRGAGQKPGNRLVSFDLFSGVAIQGGYAGLGMPDPDTRDARLYRTVLSGDLAGNDAEASDPRDIEPDRTRFENSCHVVQIVRASNVRLEGLTITAGRADISKRDEYATTLMGGGAYVVDSEPLVLKNCAFFGNYADNGGACYIGGKNVTMEDCSITRNAAVYGGGLSGGGGMTISRCEISDNYARSSAGGINAGSMTVIDCIFSGNVADYSGGAGRIYGGNTLRMSQCMITGNSALRGGGIHAEGKFQEFCRCSFTANRAVDEGGGLLLSAGLSDSAVVLSNCLLNGNSAEGGGAILGHFLGSLSVANCTIVENRALKGAFILCKAGPFPNMDMGKVSIANSIIWNNENALATEDSCISIRYSNISGGMVSVLDPNNNVIWDVGNTTADPAFAVPGHWDANNTPTDTSDDFHVEGDYHLKSQAGRFDPNTQSWVQDDTSSACIDAGDPNSPIGLEPFPNGGRINMGAYGGTAEASKSWFDGPVCETQIPGDINGDCRVDAEDLAILARNWLRAGGAGPSVSTPTQPSKPLR